MKTFSHHINKDEHGYRGNAMTALNWFTGITESVLVPTTAINHANWVGVFCAFLVFFIIFFYAGIYIRWMIKDPDRLQTEGYNLAVKGLATETDMQKGTGMIEVKSDQKQITS